VAKSDSVRSKWFIYDDSTVGIGCTACDSTTRRTDGRYPLYNCGDIASKFDKPYYFTQHFKKVSHHLPENYELIAGARIKIIHLYYDLITVAAIGDADHIKIILNVPLKTSNRYFVLYKTLALPTRIFNDTFVQYLPEFSFFGIDTVQHNYILFTEVELSHCTQSSITVYPANAAIYRVHK